MKTNRQYKTDSGHTVEVRAIPKWKFAVYWDNKIILVLNRSAVMNLGVSDAMNKHWLHNDTTNLARLEIEHLSANQAAAHAVQSTRPENFSGHYAIN